jgi:hypothetical protein
MAFCGFGQTNPSPATIHTEFDMRALLSGPDLNPKVGTISFRHDGFFNELNKRIGPAARPRSRSNFWERVATKLIEAAIQRRHHDVFLLGFTFRSFLAEAFAIFFFVLWFWLLVAVIGDLFRRHDIPAWGKAIWVLALIVFPYISILITVAGGALTKVIKFVKNLSIGVAL